MGHYDQAAETTGALYLIKEKSCILCGTSMAITMRHYRGRHRLRRELGDRKACNRRYKQKHIAAPKG